ncbi:MAG TPA: hypothetical protein VMO47_14620 [Rhodothermales bacterium]|nr:hypothetical protein [Rhodothermales bacterium]
MTQPVLPWFAVPEPIDPGVRVVLKNTIMPDVFSGEVQPQFTDEVKYRFRVDLYKDERFKNLLDDDDLRSNEFVIRKVE